MGALEPALLPPPLVPVSRFSTAFSLAKETVSETLDDEVPSLAAAVAYYTVFSLPPLLVVIVAIAGAIFGAAAVEDAITSQAEGLAGGSAAVAIRGMIQSTSDLGDSVGAKIGGIAALLFGASGAFGQLQMSLNKAWNVKKEQQKGGIVGTLLKRLVSFGMVLTIVFLLLVSLALSAFLAAAGGAVEALVPSGLVQTLLHVVNTVVAFVITTGLFAALFVVLPDTKVAWRDVWVGAAVTALLFTVGKFLIGLYLGRSNPGEAFGAAGSLALILIWIYYSSLIVLVGAEFTQVFSQRHGSRSIHPLAQAREPQPY